MRVVTALFLIVFSGCLSAQVQSEPQRTCPEAPTLRELMTIAATAYNDLTFEQEMVDSRARRTYFKDGQPFTGWAFILNVQTIHKFQFYEIVDGKSQREVAYYGNGQIDYDFSFSNDIPEGCHLKWGDDGQVLVDEFYRSGKLHGRQLQYNEEGVLLRDETFKNGVLVEE